MPASSLCRSYKTRIASVESPQALNVAAKHRAPVSNAFKLFTSQLNIELLVSNVYFQTLAVSPLKFVLKVIKGVIGILSKILRRWK